MALTKSLSEDKSQVTIRVGGRFDFNVHRDFRESYRDTDPVGTRYVVDLSDTEYMDSSALGMLLLLREHGGGQRAKVSIVNASSEIKKILDISNFDKLFEIS